MKVARLIHCLMSIVVLVAAFTIRLIDDSDNNVVFIKLELSGVIFLSRGHYNIIKDFLPTWIISFFEFYKQLTHCFILFPFLLQYFNNAQYMISSWLLRRNSHWWSTIIFTVCEINLDSRMFGKILKYFTKVTCLCKYYNLFYHPSYR